MKSSLGFLIVMMLIASPGKAFSEEGDFIQSESKHRVQVSSVPEIAQLLDHLQGLISARDATAIRNMVSQDYFFQRDFGGMFNHTKPGWWNFATNYPFASRPALEGEPWAWSYTVRVVDGEVVESRRSIVGEQRFSATDKNQSWAVFENDLQMQHIYLSADNRRFCGPAYPETPSDIRADDLSITGDLVYVSADKVNLRAGPDINAQVILNLEQGDVLEIIANKVISDPRKHYQWVNVKSDYRGGNSGFISTDLVAFWPRQRLCFQKNAETDQWRISGIIYGGD